jgi:hypothetical protein
VRPLDRLATHTWLLVSVAILVLSGLAVGCSTKPTYCADADQLKASVQNLSNVDVAKNGLGSLTTALTTVKTSAQAFATDAKAAFAPQTTALQQSLSSLDTAIKSAHGQPPRTAASTVASSVMQVKNSATNLENAVSGKCQ